MFTTTQPLGANAALPTSMPGTTKPNVMRAFNPTRRDLEMHTYNDAVMSVVHHQRHYLRQAFTPCGSQVASKM